MIAEFQQTRITEAMARSKVFMVEN